MFQLSGFYSRATQNRGPSGAGLSGPGGDEGTPRDRARALGCWGSFKGTHKGTVRDL